MAPTIRSMGELARSGTLGRLGMVHTWHFTDWVYRPRLPAELDREQGGGPVFRQASHQVDIVRSIVHRPVRSVRAMTLELDPTRPVPGAYSVYLEFDDGTPASIVYSGYGHFDLGSWLRGGEGVTARANGGADEAARKNALRYGQGGSRGSNTLGLFGLTLVTCAEADLREAAEGVWVHRLGGRELVEVPDEPRGTAELAELQRAVRGGQPLVHDGRWGQATLEVCLAIHASADTRREIILN
jgi:phthalate 4,5-cis-dihydrodiol dehydrogenase